MEALDLRVATAMYRRLFSYASNEGQDTFLKEAAGPLLARLRDAAN